MTPLAILATRLHKIQHAVRRQILVQWSLSQPKDATWEDFEEFMDMYNLHNLADKVEFVERCNDSRGEGIGPIQLDPNMIQEHEELGARHSPTRREYTHVSRRGSGRSRREQIWRREGRVAKQESD